MDINTQASELASKVHHAAIVANWGRHEHMTTADYRAAFRKELDMQSVPQNLRRFVFLRCCALSGFGA